MAGTFNMSMSQSVHDFQRLILPIFKGLWRGCEFIHTEAQYDALAQALDNYAGIDIVRLNKSTRSVTGIASRIQRSKRCWETFTVRCKRDSGTPTEYTKRTNALSNGDLFPSLVYQAYVALTNDTLSGMAIARTRDILTFVENERPVVKHTNPQQYGQASFYVISWRDMVAKNYELIRITPAQGGYFAKWRTREKFIATELIQ